MNLLGQQLPLDLCYPSHQQRLGHPLIHQYQATHDVPLNRVYLAYQVNLEDPVYLLHLVIQALHPHQAHHLYLAVQANHVVPSNQVAPVILAHRTHRAYLESLEALTALNYQVDHVDPPAQRMIVNIEIPAQMVVNWALYLNLHTQQLIVGDNNSYLVWDLAHQDFQVHPVPPVNLDCRSHPDVLVHLDNQESRADQSQHQHMDYLQRVYLYYARS